MVVTLGCEAQLKTTYSQYLSPRRRAVLDSLAVSAISPTTARPYLDEPSRDSFSFSLGESTTRDQIKATSVVLDGFHLAASRFFKSDNCLNRDTFNRRES